MMSAVFFRSVEHAGRITLASLFLFAGGLKISSYDSVLEQMTVAGLSPSWLLLPPTIALELGGGLVLAFGRWGAALTALMLAVFTLATNYYFHDFWNMEGEMARAEGALFLKNLAIAGALLFVSGTLRRGQAGAS